MKRDNVVLFYPTGIVHFRNLEVLKNHMKGFRFRVIVEPWVGEKAAEVLEPIAPEDRVTVTAGRIPAALWETVDILFLCMAYPNPFRLYLVDEAAARGIPSASIEEVNQLALNDGIIDHYFLPLDYLGVPSEVEKEKFADLVISKRSLKVTGWPFFDREAALKSGGANGVQDLKKQYKIPGDQKCCLLVLGSLKEHDQVSLETRRVRYEILDIVTGGLAPGCRLLIKPHPIETEAGLRGIGERAPGAVIIDPKQPIEPLLELADAVINRGNSQVTLLAMLRGKPVIVVPAGLTTIFHGCLDSIIAQTPDQFRRLLDRYTAGWRADYSEILDTHFPLTREQSLQKVTNMFRAALRRKRTTDMNKEAYLAILHAFLGNTRRAGEIAGKLENEAVSQLLTKFFRGSIDYTEIKILMGLFPDKVMRWHLQALAIRKLITHNIKKGEDLSLLGGFDGDVNPHYFIREIMARIELEYRAGNKLKAEELTGKFHGDYSIFDFYKQAFDMLEYVYRTGNGGFFRKIQWYIKNPTKAYARHRIKKKLARRAK
jgi:hypothetical protein